MRRSSLAIAAVALTGALMACAPSSGSTPLPQQTAPVQSLEDACQIASSEVDRVVTETEAELRASTDQALTDLRNGTVPSFSLPSVSVDGTLETIEDQITNPRVLERVTAVRDQLAALGEMPTPDTLLGVTTYVTDLVRQISVIVDSGNALRELCGITVTAP
jgi:hypothetical protein